ncbi:MAG: NTP transferase domain-containing protein [Bacteroidetes bacterium]|nr:NTP transferase domain-containing protein [Bacteroidota bacterium]
MNFGIIAAGEGSRLKKENAGISKPLLKVNGIPLIERLFTIAENNGAESINCIVNEESEDVHEYIKNRNFKVPFNFIIKSTPSSLHSFFALAPLLKGKPFCVTTVDSIFNEDEFKMFLNNSKNINNFDGVLAVTDFIDDEKPLCVEVNYNMKIISFHDEAANHKYATGGIYYFKSDIFPMMEKVLNNNVMRLRNFLKQLLIKGYQLKAYPFSKMIDVDHLKDLAAAEEFLNSLTVAGN